MKEALHLLHYVVELVAVVGITWVTTAFLVTGYYETPVILGAFTAITTIAGVETYREHKKKEQ